MNSRGNVDNPSLNTDDRGEHKVTIMPGIHTATEWHLCTGSRTCIPRIKQREKNTIDLIIEKLIISDQHGKIIKLKMLN